MIAGDEARRLGEEIAGWLAPGCERVVVAGGARRGADRCHDIEIVCLPRVVTLPRILLEPERVDLLAPIVDRLIASRRWERDARVPRWGDRHKRLWLPSAGVAVELYIARAGNFGNILAIRTGNSAFSRALVTKRRQGGLLPDGLWQLHGYLWDYAPSADERLMLTNPPRPPLACPDEAAFFARLGFPAVPDPRERDEEGARRWREYFAARAEAALPARQR